MVMPQRCAVEVHMHNMATKQIEVNDYVMAYNGMYIYSCSILLTHSSIFVAKKNIVQDPLDSLQ
jgi:hypothetical protein